MGSIVALRLLPLLLLLLAPFPLGAQGDPCAALFRKFRVGGQSAFARPSEVRPCTESVAFNKVRDLGTLNSVKHSIRHFYALYKIGARSPDPRLPSSHDPVAALNKVARTTWRKAELFYDAVRRAVQLLNDGHTNIKFGSPPFRHSLGLPLVQVLNARGQHEIRVAPASMISQTYAKILRQAPYKFFPFQYAGLLVTHIEGRPAWKYMRAWVSWYPTFYHDPSQQVNAALTSFQWKNGSEFVSYGAFGDRVQNPGTDFLRMRVLRKGRPQTVSVPWISYIRAFQRTGFASRSTYYRAFCAPQSGTTSRIAKAQRLSKTSLRFQRSPELNAAKGWLHIGNGRLGVNTDVGGEGGRLPPPLIMVDPVASEERGAVQSRGIVAISKLAQGTKLTKPGDYFPVVLLQGGKTAVIQIHTFYPELPIDSNQDFYNLASFFLAELFKSLILANRNAKQVIIDVSGNRGGYVFLIDWLVEAIVGTTRFMAKRRMGSTPLNYRADTPLVRQMQRQDLGNYNYASWSDLRGNPMTSREQFFLPLRNLTFGPKGRVGTYSAWSTFGLYSLSDATSSFFRPAFGNKPVVIFSNGLCYSACTFFTALMKLEHGVRVATVGGIKGSRMNFGGGGGGYVSDVEEAYISEFSKSIRAMADAPKRFQIRTSMFVTACNAFQVSASGIPRAARSNFPLEFQFLGNDIRVHYDMKSVADKSLVYQRVARLAFPK